MDEWISKKDLLKETGISYGQLYRWKRENLIPDAWFEKRSSFTGQETFFPRTLILERVHFILTHKDEYSLTELKNLLTPEADSRTYSIDDVKTLPNANRSALIYESMKHTLYLNHGQALTVVIAANLDASCTVSDAELVSFMETLDKWQNSKDIFSMNEWRIFAIRNQETLFPVLFTTGGEIMLPEGAEVVFSLSTSDISRMYNRMLNRIYEVK